MGARSECRLRGWALAVRGRPWPGRPSNQVAWYLYHQGYRLFGVNPRCSEPEVFGVPMLTSLDQVPEPIDLLDVFRYVEDRCLKVEHARLLGRSRRDG